MKNSASAKACVALMTCAIVTGRRPFEPDFCFGRRVERVREVSGRYRTRRASSSEPKPPSPFRHRLESSGCRRLESP